MKNIIKTTLLMITVALSFSLDTCYAMDADTEAGVRSRLTQLDRRHARISPTHKPDHYTKAYIQFISLNVDEVATHARQYELTGFNKSPRLNPNVIAYLKKEVVEPFYILKDTTNIDVNYDPLMPSKRRAPGVDPFCENSLARTKLAEIATALRDFPTTDRHSFAYLRGQDNLDIVEHGFSLRYLM